MAAVADRANGAETRPWRLEGRGLTKTFGRIKGLEAVDFSVEAGEVVGLLGDNGAGKSTLVKILSGVYAPDAGRLFLAGRPTSFSSAKDARRWGIETVYQDLALVETMSIARNFFLGAEPTKRYGPVRLLDTAAMNRIAAEALARIGIQIRAVEGSVSTLSGGERQAIAIGRTIHFGGKLLILDEPTSALSIHETNKVLGYIGQARDRGLAVIFVTHNLYHVYPIADRLVILEHGRKIGDFAREQVTLDELVRMITAGKSA